MKVLFVRAEGFVIARTHSLLVFLLVFSLVLLLALAMFRLQIFDSFSVLSFLIHSSSSAASLRLPAHSMRILIVQLSQCTRLICISLQHLLLNCNNNKCGENILKQNRYTHISQLLHQRKCIKVKVEDILIILKREIIEFGCASPLAVTR